MPVNPAYKTNGTKQMYDRYIVGHEDMYTRKCHVQGGRFVPFVKKITILASKLSEAGIIS